MSYEQDASEAALRAEVLESIPAHMQHRLLSTLIQSEWSVLIKLEHELDAQGGIALVRKVMVPQVLRSVGSAFRATAMLTFQPAWELGMRGYDSAAVTCTIQYVDETGQARLKETRKWGHIGWKWIAPYSLFVDGTRYDLRDMTTKEQKTLDHLLRQALRNQELRDVRADNRRVRLREFEGVDEPIDWDALTGWVQLYHRRSAGRRCLRL